MNFEKVSALMKELGEEVGAEGLVVVSDGTSLKTLVLKEGEIVPKLKKFSFHVDKDKAFIESDWYNYCGDE